MLLERLCNRRAERYPAFLSLLGRKKIGGLDRLRGT
jgi:hypothetical protein